MYSSAGVKAKRQQFKCEGTDTQRVLVVSLAVKESDTTPGEAHLFSPEPMTLCLYVCVHVSLSFCVFVWIVHQRGLRHKSKHQR